MRAQLQKLFSNEELLYLGSTLPDTTEDFQKYRTWLEEKRHASMTFLEQNIDARKQADKILPGVRSVIVFALPYFQENSETDFKYALYSRFRDYHKLLKERGERIVQELKVAYKGEYRIVVDSAPVLERALAAKTVDGFIGKNTCYIHPKFGSFLLLGEIFTDQFFIPDESAQEAGCATCTLCQVECPTGALDDDYKIDARKCLAYWTIENRGTIPFEFWPYLKDYVFGCDLCQTICPYNSNTPGLLPKSIETRSYPGLFEVATMTQTEYEHYFGGTPVTRARREGLRRNALIAMVVSGDSKLLEAISTIDSESHPVLQATRLQVEEYLRSR